MKKLIILAAAAALSATAAHAVEQMVAQPPVIVSPELFNPVPMGPPPTFVLNATPRVTSGPFMTAVDPNGVIVSSKRPLFLYPQEYSAMAQSPLPHDCPQATVEEDEKECSR